MQSSDSSTCYRAVACAAWVVSIFIKELHPYEREFDPHDPLIDHQHHKNQYACLPVVESLSHS